jgi:hypothetical protein
MAKPSPTGRKRCAVTLKIAAATIPLLSAIAQAKGQHIACSMDVTVGADHFKRNAVFYLDDSRENLIEENGQFTVKVGMYSDTEIDGDISDGGLNPEGMSLFLQVKQGPAAMKISRTTGHIFIVATVAPAGSLVVVGQCRKASQKSTAF